MRTRRAETTRNCGAAVAAHGADATEPGTFEPWLAGDRQTADSVAKARNPEQKGAFEVSQLVIIGGTGLIGSKLVKKLRETRPRRPYAASPDTGVNTLTGEGLD